MTTTESLARALLTLTPAQTRALRMLPVEVGSWGAPQRQTRRVGGRRGRAREIGEFPTDVVITPAGREAAWPS